MPDQGGLPPPYLDPSQYPDYIDAQRKQMLAQMLMGNAMQSAQTPSDWNQMKVVPRRGMLSNIMPIASALLANKALQGSQQSQMKYFQNMYGGGDQTATASPTTSGVPPESTGPVAPGMLPQQVDTPPAAQNPLIPAGMGRGQAQALMGLLGPEKYGESIVAPNLKPAEIRAQIRAAGIDPDSAQGKRMALAALNKSTTNIIDLRGGSTAYDANTRQPIFSAPQNGVQTQWGPNGPTQSTVPGALEASQAAAAATTAGTESQKPIKLGTDANGRDVYGFATPPAAMPSATNPSAAASPAPGGASKSYFPNAAAGGQTASPAVVQSQKTGAESGQHYASELSKNATGATEVRRSLSELRNLATQATPSATNEAKMKLGSYMIAAGVSPQTVASWLHVDIGALQAAQKQTATLAVNTIHSMTSRGTNFDLDTFMRNNPNMNMSDPSAFNRVVEYMDNKAKQEIAKQKDFAQWKSGKSPDEWETGHTAHWLDKQNEDIEAGKSNSAKPPVTKVIGGKTYIQQNGKWYEQ